MCSVGLLFSKRIFWFIKSSPENIVLQIGPTSVKAGEERTNR